MAILNAKDTINGTQGTCFAVIDNTRTELMQVKNITATVEKKKIEIPILGITGKQHKAGGWNGTGKMTAYYVSSMFRKMMLDYIKTGKDTYFELMVTNEDPTSGTGTQTVVLKGVNIDTVVFTKLDVEKEALDEEMEFTFNDVDILDTFNEL